MSCWPELLELEGLASPSSFLTHSHSTELAAQRHSAGQTIFCGMESCIEEKESHSRVSSAAVLLTKVAFKYNITANGVSKHEKGRAGKPRSLGTSSASIFEKETVCHGCYTVPSLEFK
ncbi:hypothetical protein TESG_03908 [Trichophyton tonsurans CBS 112818]|uniref:Uncharacterized protein n=1 Tax=Trichophyton tonsurans (strain CBS 112818) TaxID=647933 RepID=F2RYR6_TRIT1|nr:hypothetical protein TESG_03908 [Trichophyton tonsurans CBS 112818]